MIRERDRLVVGEIEITPEMIEAGAVALMNANIEGVFSIEFCRRLSRDVLDVAYSVQHS
ncbi:MAG: hypothetical protein GY943_30510 [Chloroflexi bacterium]|nr:hypothetical protein [Chloroflexota bacterium]